MEIIYNHKLSFEEVLNLGLQESAVKYIEGIKNSVAHINCEIPLDIITIRKGAGSYDTGVLISSKIPIEIKREIETIIAK